MPSAAAADAGTWLGMAGGRDDAGAPAAVGVTTAARSSRLSWPFCSPSFSASIALKLISSRERVATWLSSRDDIVGRQGKYRFMMS